MTRDPAGLLQRIPELESLCDIASVRKEVEKGDSFRVYRALAWAQLTGRLGSHAELARTVLSNRRLFAKPLKGMPGLGTINTVGFSLVGDAEPDAQDGTVIAMHALVILLAVPILPLGAYVIQRLGSQGLSSSYKVFARVPLSMLAWLYVRALALGAVGLIGSAGFSAVYAARYHPVYIVNGFAVPLDVQLGTVKARAAPKAQTKVTLPMGAQHGVARTEQGVAVDEVDLDVHAGVDLIAWNVAGAAALYRDAAEYRPNDAPPQPPSDGPLEVYCGKRAIEVQTLDHVFESPPKSVSMGKHESVVTRTFVAVAAMDDHPSACLSHLAEKNRLGEAIPLALALGRMGGWSDPDIRRTSFVASFATPAELLRLTQLARDENPGSVLAHRAYQDAAERAGKRQTALADYERRAAAEPDSPRAQYLAARMLRGSAALDRIEALALRFPDDPDVLRSLAYQRFQACRWPEALQAWRKLRQVAADRAVDVLEVGVESMVASGDRQAAYELLQQVFDTTDARERAAEEYAVLARGDPGRAPDALIARLEEMGTATMKAGEKRWLLRARAGLSVADAPSTALLEVLTKVSPDPAGALKLIPKLTDTDVSALPAHVWALLYGEALRTGSEAAAALLQKVPALQPADADAFGRFVRGEAVSLDEMSAPPVVLGAACVVRARNANLPADERARLVDHARARDPMRTAVTDAIATWVP